MSNENYKFSPEDRKLLTKDLCARLPYGVKTSNGHGILKLSPRTDVIYIVDNGHIPYLRPMSSMTDEEAMKVAELWGLEDVLSVSVKQDYISVEIDDGVASSETYTIWFNEIVTSIELLDWLVDNKFDYRGLIPKGLALEAKEGMYGKE